MELDSEFKRDLNREANGDGTREFRIAYKRKTDAVVNFLEKNIGKTPRGVEAAAEAIKKFGRVPVAVCMAATIADRKNRISHESFLWANQVLCTWTNRCGLENYIVNAGHPTFVDDWSREIRKFTTETS